MGELTSENVKKVFEDCLFKNEEIVDGKPLCDFVQAKCILSIFGFHKKRLESHKDEIYEMLIQLNHEFMKSSGGGMSFLNMCMTKDGSQWGEQRNAEQLMALGLASGLAERALPEDMENVLPGGVPYIVILDNQSPIKA